ncbi:hypothetical protein TTX_0409 [Thermoproteus tenax Kra 1]|uniref:Uncharacterized protein n=1 Tax=Thermoproteus tenax (strain ATCC 35583 / DSM 2078 / JCM 9277 / NBRC 100435 / Kra 1) TaxID=768679 RepID=G4RND6_THETK|nr:hypothetical protein TTX_0409 [Thermoproteus tenax Kra 1]
MAQLKLCKTQSVLDYRLLLFYDIGANYAEIFSRSGRRAVAKVEGGGRCKGVSRELALTLYPELGWEFLDVEAPFDIRPTDPVPATRVVMKVPFGVTEAVVRAQLKGYPLAEGTLALEAFGHIEFGEVVHVEPTEYAVLTDDTKLRLVEVPVEDDVIIYMRKY